MTSADTIAKPETLPDFCQHDPIVFDSLMVKSLNEVFRKGTTLEYLSYIPNLHIYDSVMNYLGLNLSMSIEGSSPEILCAEPLTSVVDINLRKHGEQFVFTPEEFWNSAVKVIERERTLLDQSDSILGEDTFGIVFLVEKSIKDVPTLFAVNLYRECWKQKIEYYLKLFQTGGMWEVGNSFVMKVSH